MLRWKLLLALNTTPKQIALTEQRKVKIFHTFSWELLTSLIMALTKEPTLSEASCICAHTFRMKFNVTTHKIMSLRSIHVCLSLPLVKTISITFSACQCGTLKAACMHACMLCWPWPQFERHVRVSLLAWLRLLQLTLVPHHSYSISTLTSCGKWCFWTMRHATAANTSGKWHF